MLRLLLLPQAPIPTYVADSILVEGVIRALAEAGGLGQTEL